MEQNNTRWGISPGSRQSSKAVSASRSTIIQVCAWCDRVLDETGRWSEETDGGRSRIGARVSHGICPDCVRRLDLRAKTHEELAIMKRRLAEWVFRPATNQFEFFGRQKAFDQLSSSRWRSHVEFAATAKEFVLEFCDRDRAPIYRLQTANTQRLLGVRLHRIYRSPFPLVVDLAIFESEVQHRFRIRKGGQVLYLGQLPLSA